MVAYLSTGKSTLRLEVKVLNFNYNKRKRNFKYNVATKFVTITCSIFMNTLYLIKSSEIQVGVLLMLIYILFKIIADKYQYMFLFFKLFNLIFTYPILPDILCLLPFPYCMVIVYFFPASYLAWISRPFIRLPQTHESYSNINECQCEQ